MSGLVKRCEWCNQELINTRSPKRKYCDDICRGRYRRSHAKTTGSYLVKCSCCLKEFRTYHDTKRYCSDKCRKKGGKINERIKITYFNNCRECGTKFKTTYREQKFCSYKCKTRHTNKQNELTRRKYYLEGDSSITLDLLVTKEKNICYICREKCNEKDYYVDEQGTIICGNDYPSVEHVIPLSKGGTHTWGNVKLAHRGCNISKSNKLL